MFLNSPKLARFALMLLASLAVIAPAAAQRSTRVPPAEIGGARVGMVYSAVRQRLLTAGYQSVRRDRDQFCGYNEQCSLPETDACAGTGAGQCSYIFQKGNIIIEVSGIHGREGQPLSQTVNAIDYRQ